ncbi:helix-turn-helix domain-containing protein [Actinocorallia longicatena]|uniref:Helix-turn-helix domain-containing protein n=1 Tax=Actinocorallia longicatena TaxID=111803 RepID=A0ABP6Q9P8_9ACTN
MSGFADLLGSGTSDPAVIEATVRAARARSPLVAALPEDEVRRHVRAIIDAAIAALDAGVPEEADLEAAASLGGDRARQGVPVAALLDGFQAGRTLIVRTLVDRGRAAGLPADELLDGVTRIDAIATALEHRMVHAHRIAELDLARTARDTEVQRLRRILHGEDPADRALHVIVTDVSDPAEAQALEQDLGGLSGLVDGRLVALTPTLPGAAAAGGGPRGAVSPLVAPARIPVMYELCRRALQTGEPGLRPLTELALATAMAAEPALGGLLADDLLAGLDPADPFHRELAETVLVYLDHAGRIEPAAAALHVHPNTVKYRIRRYRQLTGDPLDRLGVAATAHRWWALRSFLRG